MKKNYIKRFNFKVVFNLLILTFILLFALTNTTRASCLCISIPPICQAYWGSSVVFVGTVKEISSTENGYESLVKFTVEEKLRGGNDIEVILWTGSSCCNYRFVQGKRYLVYANGNNANDKLSTNICSRTKLFEEANDDLQAIRNFNNPKSQSKIFGQIVGYGRDLAGDNLLKPGNPFADIKVILSKNALFEIGKKPSQLDINSEDAVKGIPVKENEPIMTTTDKDGNYQFVGILAGSYQVEPVLPSNLKASQLLSQYIFLSDDCACAEVNIGVSAIAGISGRLVDAQGISIVNAEVELFEKKYAESINFSSNPLATITTDNEGRYQFQDVRPGYYVLGINLTFSPIEKLPYTATFYPGVLDLSKATVIELNKGTDYKCDDFKLPQPLSSRKVIGVVFWSDGVPVKDAILDIREPQKHNIPINVTTNEQGEFSLELYEGFTYLIVARKFRAKYGNYRVTPEVKITVTDVLQPLKLQMPRLDQDTGED